MTTITEAIDDAANRILAQGSRPEVRYMSATKHKEIEAIREELGVSFTEAENEWGRRRLVKSMVDHGINPENYTFEIELRYQGDSIVEMMIARLK
jgi:hypothetical protein